MEVVDYPQDSGPERMQALKVTLYLTGLRINCSLCVCVCV